VVGEFCHLSYVIGGVHTVSLKELSLVGSAYLPLQLMMSMVFMYCSWWWGYFQTIYNHGYGHCRNVSGTGKHTFTFCCRVLWFFDVMWGKNAPYYFCSLLEYTNTFLWRNRETVICLYTAVVQDAAILFYFIFWQWPGAVKSYYTMVLWSSCYGKLFVFVLTV